MIDCITYLISMMFLFSSLKVFPLNPEEEQLQILFYNVENLFDTKDDPHISDEEFLPNGIRHWTNKRYNDKLIKIAKVFLASGGWTPPDIIGLCEIENYEVLEQLQMSPLLSKYNYQIIHQDSPDRRGIDVALLYQNSTFKPFYYQAIPVIDPLNKEFRTRDILMVKGIIGANDTVAIFVNHWPSRYGGLMETEAKRSLAAKTLRNEINAIHLKSPNTIIICMGDFNDEPFDKSIKDELQAKKSDNKVLEGELINLSSDWETEQIKTHKHQQNWETFDQFIVSDNLLNNQSLYVEDALIFSPDFLLQPDKKFLGKKPYRTYSGFRYNGGFSDHLPIILRLKILEN